MFSCSGCPSLSMTLGESPSPIVHVIPLWLPLLRSKQQTTQNIPTAVLGHGLAISLVMCVCDTSCAIQSSALDVLWSEESKGPDAGVSE